MFVSLSGHSVFTENKGESEDSGLRLVQAETDYRIKSKD